MKTEITIAIATFTTILGIAATVQPAWAQETTIMPERTRHAVGLDGGLDEAFVVRATYSYRLGWDSPPDARIWARFTLPVVLPDLGDWAVEGGLQASALRWRDLRLALSVGPILKLDTNRLFTAFAAGLGATMLAGYEGPRWGLSLEAGWEQMLATYLRHSDRYVESINPGAKSGWYAASGSVARLGARGGFRVGSVEVFARVGVDATGLFNALTPPFYGTVGVGAAF